MSLSIVFFFVFTMLVSYFDQANAAASENDMTIFVNEERLKLENPPRVQAGRVLLPVRQVFESLGAEVEWIQEKQTARGSLGDILVELPVGSSTARVNGEEEKLQAPSMIYSGRIYVPLRFTGEAFGANVKWDAEEKKVSIHQKSTDDNTRAPAGTLIEDGYDERREKETTAQEADSETVAMNSEALELSFKYESGEGFMKVQANQSTSSGHRIMVEKEGERYFYSICEDRFNIPLQLGDGQYTLVLLEHSSGNNYSVVEREKIDVSVNGNGAPYLHSSWPVLWDEKGSAAQLAEDLVKGLDSEEEKIKAVYDYIINHIEYDHDKIEHIDHTYVPDIEQTHQEKKGICYDYSALFAAMMRHQDVPTKLVKGYKDDLTEYHAWNEVYIQELDKWKIIDTTYDAPSAELAGDQREIYKDRSEYEVNKIY